MLIEQRVIIGGQRFFDYFPEVLRIVKLIEIAFDFSVYNPGQLHRIGKDFIARLFPVKPPCVMLSCAF